MTKQPFIFHILLIVVICSVISFPCFGQQGTPFTVDLNPEEKNGSMAWWEDWRPIYQTKVSF